MVQSQTGRRGAADLQPAWTVTNIPEKVFDEENLWVLPFIVTHYSTHTSHMRAYTHTHTYTLRPMS